MAAEPMQVIVISDYVCPWCYIGLHRLKRMEEEYLLDVQWWPFELHPETPAEGVRVEQLIERRGMAYEQHRQRLKAYAAESGIELASNRVVANSHKALELGEYARDHASFREVHEALFGAYFTEARNIGDPDVLEAIAGEAGLDPAAARAALDRGDYAARVDQATAEARQNGYGSTPTMIFDNRTYIPGVQDYEVYQNVLDKLEAPKRNGSGGPSAAQS